MVSYIPYIKSNFVIREKVEIKYLFNRQNDSFLLTVLVYESPL